MDLREKENSESFRSQVMAQESFHKARLFFRTCRHAQKEYSPHSLGVLPLLSYLLFRPVCPVSSSSGAEPLSPVWEAGSFVPSARGRSTMRSPAPDALSQPLPAAVIVAEILPPRYSPYAPRGSALGVPGSGTGSACVSESKRCLCFSVPFSLDLHGPLRLLCQVVVTGRGHPSHPALHGLRA